MNATKSKLYTAEELEAMGFEQTVSTGAGQEVSHKCNLNARGEVWCMNDDGKEIRRMAKLSSRMWAKNYSLITHTYNAADSGKRIIVSVSRWE